MAIDPGGKSGVAHGLFSDEMASVGSAIERAMLKRSIRAYEVHGTAWEQANIIARMWLEFQFQACVSLSIPAANTSLVIEDFQLRKRSADLAPVAVTAGIKTLLTKVEITDQSTDVARTGTRKKNTGHGVKIARVTRWPVGEPIMQQPSSAMNFATNARLKEWGAYPLTIGSEHRRDAVRHLCVRLSEMLES
jgi:hypothetical protein